MMRVSALLADTLPTLIGSRRIKISNRNCGMSQDEIGQFKLSVAAVLQDEVCV